MMQDATEKISKNIVKSLIIRDDYGRVTDMVSCCKVARDIGEKAFKTNNFKIIDILGKFAYGYVIVYMFERTTASMNARKQETEYR